MNYVCYSEYSYVFEQYLKPAAILIELARYILLIYYYMLSRFLAARSIAVKME